MMIAARNAFLMGGAKPWQNPYITDGLVAMWDGEWNAAAGVHDTTPRLVDISGHGHDIQLPTNTTLHDNYVLFDQSSTAYPATASNVFAFPDRLSAELTVDTCSQALRSRSGTSVLVGSIVGCGGASGAGFPFLWLRPNNRLEIGYINNASYGTPTSASVSKRSGENNIVRYINGEEEQLTSNWSGSSANVLYLTDVRLFASDAGSWSYKMFSVRIYSRALTAAEVAANYAIDAARFGL